MCLKCYLVFPFSNCLDVFVLNRLNRSVGLYKSTRGTLQCVHTDVKLSSVSSKSTGFQKIVGKHVGLETLSDLAFKIPSFLYNIFVWYDFVLHRLRSIVPSVYIHTRVHLHMHLHWYHVKSFHLKKRVPKQTDVVKLGNFVFKVLHLLLINCCIVLHRIVTQFLLYWWKKRRRNVQ